MEAVRRRSGGGPAATALISPNLALRRTPLGIETAKRFADYATVGLTVSADSPPLHPPLVTAMADR